LVAAPVEVFSKYTLAPISASPDDWSYTKPETVAVRAASGASLGTGGFVLVGGTLVCLAGAATAAVRT
jgi:hypothetical protein